MLGVSFLVECVGTALFFIIILVSGKPLHIAIALLAMLYIFGPISGGHFNCGISLMTWLKGDMPAKKCLMYICAQLIGMVIALMWYKQYGHHYKKLNY